MLETGPKRSVPKGEMWFSEGRVPVFRPCVLSISRGNQYFRRFRYAQPYKAAQHQRTLCMLAFHKMHICMRWIIRSLVSRLEIQWQLPISRNQTLLSGYMSMTKFMYWELSPRSAATADEMEVGGYAYLQAEVAGAVCR